MTELLIHSENKSMACSPTDEETLKCEVFETPYLTTKVIKEEEPTDTIEVDRVRGNKKTIMWAGTHIIFRDG